MTSYIKVLWNLDVKKPYFVFFSISVKREIIFSFSCFICSLVSSTVGRGVRL
jgi:hypothetical protein